MNRLPDHRKQVAVAVALTLALGAASTISAPATTPGPGRSAISCAVEPRSFANIRDILSAPVLATPAATTSGQTLPSGTPATASEREAIHALVQEWLACQNAGELFRSWALFSDAYLYRLLSRQGPFPETLYQAWATPQPVAEETATLLEIAGERRLDDGRLGATVRIEYASIPMPKQFFFYFAEENDGALLIDSILGEISFSVP